VKSFIIYVIRQILSGDQMKKEGVEKYVQNFSRETWRREITKNT
jgi:hypothetical protein